jgi:hypothetical protein
LVNDSLKNIEYRYLLEKYHIKFSKILILIRKIKKIIRESL